jgi:hypothetical protein
VWDYITEAELDAAGQCFMDFWLEPPEPLFSALDGEGHLFGQDLALKSEFFMVETIADEKALTLTVPCEGGLVVKIWADKPLGGTEEGLDHAVSDPACLQDGSCSCDPLCIFVEVSMDGQPAVSATGGTVMFGCDPNDCDCGFMSYAFREAKLTFADALGQKQFLSVHALGPDWMPKDEWIQAVTAEP